MSRSSNLSRAAWASWGRELWAAFWPGSTPQDTEWQRRRKAVVRTAQLAVAAMVTAAMGGAILADAGVLSAGQIATMILLALLYVAWGWHGLRQPIRVALWESPPDAPLHWVPRADARTVFFFLGQVGLAGILFALGNQGRGGRLAWLVLLPPVAYSVILLPRGGVTVVTMATMGLLAVSVGRWQGWPQVPGALVAFSFSVLFTLVFTFLAVGAERSRNEVQRLAQELTRANQQLREYAVQAQELAATQERNRLAREIHDSLGHYLTAVHMQLEAARALQDREPGSARDAIAKAQTLTKNGLQEIRRSVSALRASPLDNQTLEEALRQVTDESRAGGLNATLEIVGRPRDLPPAAKLTLYRAGQEGLTNVRKHAGTAQARLTLDFRQSTSIRLVVEDQGSGTPETGNGHPGFGLLGLRERAHLLGGEVRTSSQPGAGFTLEVEVPA